ncbi:MAG: DUF4962 domain-containing protein [Clostridia bacterium]|nr:DUF4962 domain-containing protein [Clostridia bacterium]
MKRILCSMLVVCIVLSCTVWAQDIQNEADSYKNSEYTFSGEFVKKKQPLDYTLDDSKVQELKGQHPRLFFNAEELENIKAEIYGNEAHKATFDEFIKVVDSYVEAGPEEWYVSENKEENWIRDVADSLSAISFAYMVTNDTKYLDSAITYIETICSYPHWGAPGSSYHNNGLACAHALRALAVSYDWMFDILPPSTKKTLLKTAQERGATMNAGGWWRGSYMQNHLWNDRYAAAVIGAAIMDEHSEAVNWIKKSIEDYNKVYSFMGEDGGSHEGMLYWKYGYESYLQFKLLMKRTFEIDYTIDKYDENSWLAPMYNFIGINDWGTNEVALNFGDSSLSQTLQEFWPILEYITDTYNNGHSKWLADNIHKYCTENNIGTGTWWVFLVLNDVEPVPPKGHLMTGHLFEDLGYVHSRSDWNGNESVFGIRCGMNTGTESLGYNGNAGSSHVHPDIGAPLLYGYGEYLLRDDGYGTTSRTNHSELFINGSGQVWDKTKEYLLNSYPYIANYKDTADYTYAACNGTDAYGALPAYIDEFQLENWVRHVLFLKKKDALLVVDEVKTTSDKELEFRWFTESQNIAKQGKNAALAVGNEAQIKIETLNPDSDVWIEPREVPYRTGTRNAICVGKNGREWTTATAITWSPKEKAPKTVLLDKYGDEYTFDLGSAVVKLNIKNYNIELTDYGNEMQIMINKKIFKNNLPILIEDDAQYMPFADLLRALGYKVEYIAETDSVSVTRGTWNTVIPLSNEKKDNALWNVDNRSRITPKQLTELVGVISYYDISNNLIKIKTKDFDNDASLSNIVVSNAEVISSTSEGDEFTITALGDSYTLSPVANSISATAVIEQKGENQYKAIITAEDRKTKKEISVNIKRPVGLGDVPIKNYEAIGDDGNVPKNSLDTLASTYWAYNEVGAWIIYELENECEIDGVKTSWNKWNARDMNFEIYTSMDKENWDLAGKFFFERGEEFRENKFDPVKCKYVKLVGMGNSTNSWCSLTDIGFLQKK